MFIQTETTPNPATLKFLPGQVVELRGAGQGDDRLPLGAARVRGRGHRRNTTGSPT